MVNFEGSGHGGAIILVGFERIDVEGVLLQPPSRARRLAWAWAKTALYG